MEPTSSSTSSAPLRTAVIGLALAGTVLLVVLAPRLFGLEATSWWVTVAVGVAMGAAVVAYGYAKRDAGEPDLTTPEP